MKQDKIHLLMMQRKIKHHTAQGFILAEVLIAILLTLILTGISMGVVVMATAIKVRGDELSDATRWMQEDLEDIKVKANGVDAVDPNATPITYSTLSKCQTSTFTPSQSNGYGSLLMTPPATPAITFLNGGSTIAAGPSTFTKTSSSGTRTYNLVRTATVKNVAPYNVLQLNYSVTKNSGATVSTSYSEVIPGASFYCK
jgi:type II secretory pathway pseudopilin PulG